MGGKRTQHPGPDSSSARQTPATPPAHSHAHVASQKDSAATPRQPCSTVASSRVTLDLCIEHQERNARRDRDETVVVAVAVVMMVVSSGSSSGKRYNTHPSVNPSSVEKENHRWIYST